MFLIALVAMVCCSVNAQTATETFNFPKMTDIPTGAWTINQKLAAVLSFAGRRSFPLP